MSKLFWLSFCDPDASPGQRFLGVAIVEADSFLDAVLVAKAKGCNPGGEVAGRELHGWVGFVQPEHCNRLLSQEETITLACLLSADPNAEVQYDDQQPSGVSEEPARTRPPGDDTVVRVRMRAINFDTLLRHGLVMGPGRFAIGLVPDKPDADGAPVYVLEIMGPVVPADLPEPVNMRPSRSHNNHDPKLN